MKPCILLIEDDRDMRELVAGNLEHSGFDVQKADDGIKGQALALQYIPDLIVLDLLLPRVDGLTLCQRLRRDDRRLRRRRRRRGKRAWSADMDLVGVLAKCFRSWLCSCATNS